MATLRNLSAPIPAAATPPRVWQDRQLWSIQYLRALAAIGVVVFHLLQGLPLMWLGEHGVDLFFVISGFMMVVMTADRGVTPGQFMLDRITRIVPLYWLATLTAFAIVIAGGKLFAVSGDPAMLGKSLLFIPAFGERGQIWPTLFLGWTLNYEMFFYALFAACLLTPRRWRLKLLSAALGLLAIIGLAASPTSAIAQTWTNPLLLEFAAGTWLGAISGAGNDRFAPGRAALLMLGVAALLMAVSPIWPRMLFGAASVAIIAVALFVERRQRLPRIYWLKRLGDTSYAIYLCQGFALEAVTQGMIAASRATGLRLDQVRFSAPIGLVAAIALGYVVSVAVERPATSWLRRRVGGFLHAPVRLS